MGNEIVMNVTPGETRIARFENGVLNELSIERDSDVQVAGNIYMGRITRVLPGMQAAFVDIGLEKAAFLYVADVVSDLFEGIQDEDDEEEDSAKEDVVEGDAEEGEDEDGEPEEENDTAEDRQGSSQESSRSGNGRREGGRYARGRRGGRTANFKQRGGRQVSRGRSRRRAPLPRIEDVVREGQTIVVQVAKEPIRTKGARVTSHISLPGRYLVYMPTVSHVGVSRRIGSYEERVRLKDVLHKNRPASGGFIARTSCIGVSEERLVDDMKNLTQIWQQIYEKQEKNRPPALLYSDLDIILRSVRDSLSKDVDRLVIDSREDYELVREYITKNMPEHEKRIELYDRDTPIFDVYGIESEITRALSKKVWLKSGGYIIIDSAEALTVIDVNTGKFVGKRDFDDTIVQTNMEAVEEISYQLKLRSIGGIIIIDFIDMQRYTDRMRVYHSLREALRQDRVKTTISKISELGLIEMTRKRTRDSLTQMLSETCFYCHGTGFNKTPITVAFEIFREIKRVYSGIDARSILVRTHPRVAKVLFNEGRERLDQLEEKIARRIVIETDEAMQVETFEIRGREAKKTGTYDE